MASHRLFQGTFDADVTGLMDHPERRKVGGGHLYKDLKGALILNHRAAWGLGQHHSNLDDALVFESLPRLFPPCIDDNITWQ